MRIAGFLQQVSGFAPNTPARSAAPQGAPTSPDQVSIASPNRYLQTPDGQQVRLPEQGCFQIGRHADCQVNLDGDLVSRRHCQGEFRNGQLWLKDCSSNGTFVNGKPLTQGEWKEIPADAQIGFGQSVHTMQLGSRGSCVVLCKARKDAPSIGLPSNRWSGWVAPKAAI